MTSALPLIYVKRFQSKTLETLLLQHVSHVSKKKIYARPPSKRYEFDGQQLREAEVPKQKKKKWLPNILERPH